MHAGHLYERGNYQQATELARQLVLDTQARAAMAAAARSETETLGWMAAIRRVRDMQYGRAVATFRAHKRCVQGLGFMVKGSGLRVQGHSLASCLLRMPGSGASPSGTTSGASCSQYSARSSANQL